jgi:hypothetical protein
MKESIESVIRKLYCESAPTSKEIDRLLSFEEFYLDKDFVEFIASYSGCEGPISQDRYIQFWKIDDLIELNPYYKHVDECRNFFFFGSDGSNLGYGFDKTNGSVIAIDFLEIGNTKPRIVGESFEDFLMNLVG